MVRVETDQEKIARLEHDLAECYKLTGADPDGNEDWRLAVTEVQILREDHDALAARPSYQEISDKVRREISREVVLQTIGRVSQSGTGTGSDICEDPWMLLADYGIHADGKTSMQTYVKRLLDQLKT